MGIRLSLGVFVGDLLFRAASEESLLAAWEEVRENAAADGDLGPEVTAFGKGVLGRLARLAGALRDGSWEPHPVVAIEVPKAGGGTRLLAVPHVEDRVVERAVLEVVEPHVDPVLSPWSFAYRKGLGVRDALAALAEARDGGCTWVARADVRDCFEEMPRWPVLSRLEDLVPDAELRLLVQRLVQRHATGPARRRIGSGKGLHQGSALSPVLANLYLDGFDRAMARAGYQVLRYGDDFAVPVASRSQAEQVLTLAAEELARLDLELNAAKSRAVSFDEGVEFLGDVTGATGGRRVDVSAHPLEGTVFVVQQGALLRSRGDRLKVEKGDDVLLSVGMKRVRQVVATGRVGMTTAFLHRALREDIDLVLLDDDGRFLGRMSGPGHRDVELRHAQHRAADKPGDALELARGFVAGKTANMRTGVLRAARRVPILNVHPAAERMAASRTTALHAASIAELMGCEGAATRDYFAVLGAILGEAWAFPRRARRPPPDPVNAMLSFGYTLLTQDAVAACEIAGLDPAVGFLHGLRNNRPNLALDLIEEFRPVTVDAMIICLTSTGGLSPADFTTTDTDPPSCRLSDEARATFLRAYERRMLTIAHHPSAGRKISYRTALLVQARHLAAVIEGREPAYRPLAWR